MLLRQESRFGKVSPKSSCLPSAAPDHTISTTKLHYTESEEIVRSSLYTLAHSLRACTGLFSPGNGPALAEKLQYRLLV